MLRSTLHLRPQVLSDTKCPWLGIACALDQMGLVQALFLPSQGVIPARERPLPTEL